MICWSTNSCFETLCMGVCVHLGLKFVGVVHQTDADYGRKSLLYWETERGSAPYDPVTPSAAYSFYVCVSHTGSHVKAATGSNTCLSFHYSLSLCVSLEPSQLAAKTSNHRRHHSLESVYKWIKQHSHSCGVSPMSYVRPHHKYSWVPTSNHRLVQTEMTDSPSLPVVDTSPGRKRKQLEFVGAVRCWPHF